MNNMFKTLIKNGTIVDGTGSSSYHADIGISGGIIKAIGDFSSLTSPTVIDAQGLIVCPGFIDIHTHSDFTLISDPRAMSAIHQGVTCEVIGQCGFGAAPLKEKATAKKLFGYHPSVTPSWDSFASYLSTLSLAGPAVNVASLVGHAVLRYAAIPGGQGKASQSAIEQMCAMLEDALTHGYWGLSIGLEYEPGIHATTDELLALAKVVAKHDGLMACHVRNRDLYYDMAFAEVISIARQTGVKLQISHISPKYGAPADAVKNTLTMIEQCNAQGGRVGFDIIPDNWGPTTMASILPDWMYEDGIEGALEQLNSKELRAKAKQRPNPIWRLVLDKRWDLIRLVSWTGESSMVGKTIEEIANDRSVEDPHDAVFDLLLEAGKDMFSVTWAGWNFAEEDQKQLLVHELCGIISDAQTVAPDGPLREKAGAPSVYGWVAQFIERYVKEDPLLTLEQAVHKITGLPASRMGFKDRGLIRPGQRADLTIFDLESMHCNATLAESRLFPSGLHHVLVNGDLTLTHSKLTGVRAGMVV